MTEKKIVELEISKETAFDLKFVDGKVKAIVSYDGKGVDGGMYIDMSPAYFLDKVAEMIPGTTDDKLIDMLKIALKLS